MNIVYKPLTMDAKEDFYTLAGDERVAATMRFDCPKTLDESTRILEDYISDGNRAFAIRSKADEKLLGIFAFKSDPGSDTADMSLMLAHDVWGLGIGGKVIGDMVSLAKKEKWYATLCGYILETNTASRAIAVRMGFSEIARKRFPGMMEDLVVYQLEIK